MATTQEYAYLSEHAYENLRVGVRKPDEQEKLTIGGKDYLVLEHASNRFTGYQGTVYQEYPNGEIIVAHRGTESPIQDPLDAKADWDMVRSRVNPQANDALALTERAQKYARDQHRQNPDINPTVTVTGHSLGGALAEICAHKYGLYGEAFNGYGAVSLNNDIPRGGNHFTNHVMAGDLVSAGSPHYGKVVVHASIKDVQVIEHHERNRTQTGATIQAAADLVNDHGIGNFTGHGKNNILDDPHARTRANEHATSIAHFRTDVANDRWLSSAVLTTPSAMTQAFKERLSDIEEQRTQHPGNQRYHPSYEYNDKGQEKGYNRKPSMFGGSSDASDVLAPSHTTTQLSPTQNMQHDWTVGLLNQNPRFDSFTDPQKSTIAYGIIRQIADSGQDINKLQLVTLAPDGVTVAAKLDSPVGMVSLPLKDALQTSPQDVVLAQTDLGERNHTAAMLREQQQSQSRGMSIS